jgi:hypothetical protein
MSKTRTVDDCGSCPFFHSNSEYPDTRCGAEGMRSIRPMGYWKEGDGRPSWCPLPVRVVAREGKERRRP